MDYNAGTSRVLIENSYDVNNEYMSVIRQTYLLTPWIGTLLEKLTGSQLVRKCPAFYGTGRFITAGTSGRHLPLFSASSIQSITPHLTS